MVLPFFKFSKWWSILVSLLDLNVANFALEDFTVAELNINENNQF